MRTQALLFVRIVAAVASQSQTPGREINKLFRLARDEVLATTNSRQEPYTYGSSSGKDEFFDPSAPVAATRP